MITGSHAEQLRGSNDKSLLEEAAVRVQTYLSSVPGLPKNLLVIPAAGEVAWPGLPVNANIRAEVWVVVSRDDPAAKPLMMFAVRPATGEVHAMFLVDLEKHSTYR
ncbi:MAG: hypothetical protein VKN33_01370 [Candidatus Sericytochromatia bacterium]|nr:hypothetical protein [Candidatus Sericytochromatia bacterium]